MKAKLLLAAMLLSSLMACRKSPDLESESKFSLNGKAMGSLNAMDGSGPPSSAYTLMYQDDFSETGGVLDSANWVTREGSGTNFANLPGNVRLAHDSTEAPSKYNLYLDFKYNSSNNLFSGGGIISKHNFGYGYYEARVKLYRASPGLHQSFWTMGSAYSAGTPLFDNLISNEIMPYQNQLIEIDGFEEDSNPSTADNFYFNYHDYVPQNRTFGGSEFTTSTAQWVTVGFEWQPGYVKSYVNGVLVYTNNLNDPNNTFEYAAQPIWLTALAQPQNVPKDGSGAFTQTPVSGAHMEVEYVRYYAKRLDGVNIIGNGTFEGNATKMSLDNPNCWIESISNGYDKSASGIDNVNYHTGTHSLRHLKTAAYKAKTFQKLEYIRNGTYSLSAWVKSGPHTKTLSTMNVSGTGVVSQSVDIPENLSDWTQISLTNIQVTNNTLTVAFSSDANANEYIYVDDVELINTAGAGEILIDNTNSAFSLNDVSDWTLSTGAGKYGANYYYTGVQNPVAPFRWGKWTPSFPSTNLYEVYMWWPENANRPDTARVEVVSTYGTTVSHINQRINGGKWNYLGTHTFTQGNTGYVKIYANDSGYTIADAVKFVLQQ